MTLSKGASGSMVFMCSLSMLIFLSLSQPAGLWWYRLGQYEVTYTHTLASYSASCKCVRKCGGDIHTHTSYSYSALCKCPISSTVAIN